MNWPCSTYPQGLEVSILLSDISQIECSKSCWTLWQEGLIFREVGAYLLSSVAMDFVAPIFIASSFFEFVLEMAST